MNEINGGKNSTPIITLMLLSPLIAEVLPGATRLSSLFVFPVEVFVWGGGALLIRYAYRKWQLGWINVLLLSFALSVAEEFLIQQTSVAPMVLQIKGVVYARTFGVNYVYFLWALIYESVFVVFLPIFLTELIFKSRRNELWIGKRGLLIVSLLFLFGCFMAWYSWTQIARPTVFHVPTYNPQFALVSIALVIIICLVFIAIGPFHNRLLKKSIPLNPPPARLLAIIGGLWAIILYGLVLLGFGILPTFPPLIAIGVGFLLGSAAIIFLPRWTAHPNWDLKNSFFIIIGTIIGSMLAGFIGFIGAIPMDLYFKILINILALIFMIKLSYRMRKN
jgi:hypothetical protein